MTDERLSPNFWLSEFLVSQEGMRRGIPNNPTPTDLLNLRSATAPGMQRVRDLLGKAVLISSGYRSVAINRAVGGVATSQHCTGQAVDFTSPDFGTPQRVAKFLADRQALVQFDQLIYEGRWVHISFAPKPRGQVLTANFSHTGVSYTQGIA